MNNCKKSQSGSALLIALLLIGAIGAIILTISRTNLIKLRISTNLNQSQIAFYAAEAGIEEGLLAYRADKNNQVPFGDGQEEPTVDSSEYRKVNLESITTNSTIVNSNQIISREFPYYLLKIYYKKDRFGARMKKDDIRELKIDRGTTLNINWNLEYADGTPAPLAKGILEYSTLDKNNNMVKKTNPVQPDPNNAQNAVNNGNFSFVGIDGILQIRFILARDWNQALTETQFNQVRMKLSITSSSGLIDSGKTYIESIGYFGEVKRKLVAEIDRKSGSLINIFDYTLYSQGNID